MRDKLKNLDYFRSFIEEETETIDFFINKLESGELDEDRIIPVKTEIQNTQLGILIAKYSMGAAIDELKYLFAGISNEWDAVYSTANYNKKIKMLSLMVLLNVDIKEEMVTLLKNEKEQDWLIGFLLNYLTGKSIYLECDLLFPEGLSVLKESTISEDKVGCIKKYLEKHWYNKDCGCYEAHKSKENVYYGYWSFEAGAIAKILGIDDSLLKDVKYYPYDLVHFEG